MLYAFKKNEIENYKDYFLINKLVAVKTERIDYYDK